MTYKQALKYLESFIDYEKLSNYAYTKAFGLERIKKLLELLGNPQDSLRCIHVAGTKGKGSTCAFIAYILRQAGYKTGLYTSPHLLDFRERIRILSVPRPSTLLPREFEGMISRKDLVRLIEKIKPVIERFKSEYKYSPLTFFEVYTALAFIYFRQKNVDLAVLETGLGGRLDATNVVDSLISVIAPISLEHTKLLGNTLRKIAKEKAGIIKKSVVVTAPQKKEVLDVIRNRCKKVGARLYEVKKYKKAKLMLPGEHQLINAAVARKAIETLNFYGIKINTDYINRGLRNTVWPGRCEVIFRNPLVVLDGAQNVVSICVLKKAIKDEFKYKRLILVLGISNDKDIKGICRHLYDFSDKVILTRADNPRAADPERLARYFTGKDVYKTNGVKEAIDMAHLLAGKEDLILVTGSLFVVGEFRKQNVR